MGEKLNSDETVSHKELLMTNMIELQAIAQLLIEKGIIIEDEYFSKLQQVQTEYMRLKRDKVSKSILRSLDGTTIIQLIPLN